MRFPLFALLALAALPALAEEHGHEHGRAAAPLLPAYQQECSACHVAYPPGLLPASSWQHLMDNLPRHYGSDASLDAPLAREIAAWLQANAGSGKRASAPPPEDRITRGSWFQRAHREVAAAAWARPSVKSAANCGACHPGAAEGRYSEHEVRIPR